VTTECLRQTESSGEKPGKGSDMCAQRRTFYSANRFNVRIPAVREFQSRYEAIIPISRDRRFSSL